jgi:hypothetical protein
VKTPTAESPNKRSRALCKAQGRRENNLNIMAWNAQNLTWGSKELGMLQLFRSNDVSVAIVTEAEVPAAMGGLDIDGYVSFVPDVDPLDKLRVIVYVRSDVATVLNARLATDILTFEQQ